MNKVVLMGRLCNDPELRYAGEKNSPVTNFTIAVNRDYKNNEGKYDADFIECEFWGRKSEIFCKYMTKGELVGIEGSLRLNRFTTKDGEDRSIIKVKVDEFTFIPQYKRKEIVNNTFNSNDVFEGEISESDIPFYSMVCRLN